MDGSVDLTLDHFKGNTDYLQLAQFVFYYSAQRNGIETKELDTNDFNIYLFKFDPFGLFG